MDNAEKELRLRLYRWSLAETLREVETGYPLLKLFWDDLVALRLYIAEAQDLEKQQTLAIASVKRFHPEAVRSAGEALMEAEREILEYADNLVSYHLPKGTAYKLRYGQQYCQDLPLPRRQLLPVLRGEMAEVDKALLGKRQHITSVELDYESEIGDWQSHTRITTRPSNFDCLHILARTTDTSAHKWSLTGHEFPLAHFSYCSLLGISSMGWTVFNAGDAEIAAANMVKICTKMLTEIPPLLES